MVQHDRFEPRQSIEFWKVARLSAQDKQPACTENITGRAEELLAEGWFEWW